MSKKTLINQIAKQAEKVKSLREALLMAEEDYTYLRMTRMIRDQGCGWTAAATELSKIEQLESEGVFFDPTKPEAPKIILKSISR